MRVENYHVASGEGCVRDIDQTLEERGWRDGYRVRSDRRVGRGCRGYGVGHGRRESHRHVHEGSQQAVRVPAVI